MLSSAEKLILTDRVGELISTSGGAAATVDGGLATWVGVVDGVLTSECACKVEGEELCVHAVAVTVLAVRAGFAWASFAIPPSRAGADPRVRQFAEIAATLGVNRLATIVGEHAVTDRRLAAHLLAAAGRIAAPTDAELVSINKLLNGIADDATSGDMFTQEDVAKAGRSIREEIEVLAQRPPNEGAVVLVEHVAQLWDRLAGHLYDGDNDRWYDEYYEVGPALRAVHVRMCQQLDVDPKELVDRLVDVIQAAGDDDSCLDAPEDYITVIGEQGVEELKGRRRYG